MNKSTLRTIDIDICVVDVKDTVVGRVTQCKCDGTNSTIRNIGIEIDNVDVQLDVMDATKSTYQASVIIGNFLKGKDGKDGYTPQRGVDYWTPADIQEIHDYIHDQGFLTTQVVEALPVSGVTTIIYQLDMHNGKYKEYMYTDGHWNLLGAYSWNDLEDKPDLAEPLYWESM